MRTTVAIKSHFPLGAKKVKKVGSFNLWDFFGFVNAKLIQFFTFIFGVRQIDVAFISELRCSKQGEEKFDCRRFGFNFKKFEVLDWIQYKLRIKGGKTIRGQLFMIGLRSTQMAEQRKKAQEYFLKAVDRAIAKGAKIILLAANTKAIFGRGNEALKRLAELRPGIIFTLGDNLTAAFLNECIEAVFYHAGMDPEKANILIVAARGILATSSIYFLKERLGCKNVFGAFDPNYRLEVLETKAREAGVIPLSIKEPGQPIDLVVACDSTKPYYLLTADAIEKIRRPNGELLVVDPCQPPSVSAETIHDFQGKITYCKAGDGYNPKLNYVLGIWAAKVLGMRNHVYWGCFSETFTLFHCWRERREIEKENWFAVTSEKIEFISPVAKQLGFSSASTIVS